MADSPAFSHLRLTRHDGGIAVAVLHSDGGSLTMDRAAVDGLAASFRTLAHDPSIRVLVVTGAGERFSAPGPFEDGLPAIIAARTEAEIGLARALADLPFPVIAAVNGALEAHGELGLFADLVLAAEGARFGDHRWREGRPPAGAALSAWQAALGHARANALLLGVLTLSAEEALALGFVHSVAPRGALAALALQHAARLASQPDLALRFTRQTMIRRLRQRFEDDAPLSLALSGVAALGAADWSPASPPPAAS